jgi:multiple antibiotic resistance protein
MLQTAISGFVMLMVTVGPLDAAALFAVLAAGRPAAERRAIAVRAILIATVVLTVFAVGGAGLLALLHISMPAFRLAGGLLLLLVAIDLMFVHPTGLTSITTAEAEEAGEASRRDLAVFPLAVPLIAGPGSIAATVLLMAGSRGPAEAAVVVATLIAVMGLTLLALLLSGPAVRLLGVTGTNVVARVSGIVLAALAMQLMLDGVRDAALFAPAPPPAAMRPGPF